MNKDKIRLWVDALRSGEYEQGTGVLTGVTPEGRTQHCCLGVVCQVAIKDGLDLKVAVEEMEGTRLAQRLKYGDDEVAFLPEEVAVWLGLPAGEGSRQVGVDYQYGVEGLTYLNDAKRLPFPQIADLIERTYLKEEK